LEILKELTEFLINGNAPKVEELTQKAIDENVSSIDILNKGLVAGMEVVGDKFKNNEFYVPEVLIAARAMKAGMKLIKPLLIESGVKSAGTVVIGTIKGDLHDIGKNLVGMMLEGAGYEVVDLGVDVSAEQFAGAVKKHNAEMVGMSALLTTTMINMKNIIDHLKSEKLSVKTIIGGAPVTNSYAEEVGADGYAPDAASAVEVVKTLV
jgi:5-methyltetrahydrofolate--homocysteine methyltransferase